ncbi:MAG: NTP transferase domain-containing protein [Spirochaetes bacterium]|nr:NTP transferase domain-containing protein [Spirochaetota bacterium]
MKNKKISALILSAGFSSRMGAFKPLLKFGNLTIIEFVINLFLNSGIEDITVVTGHRSDELSERLSKLKVNKVYNADYETGMFSSVLAGVRSLSECDAFFLLPVDIPLIRKYTITGLMDAFSNNNSDVVYPVFQNRRGHPPLLSSNIVHDILGYNGEGGLAGLLSQYTNITEHRVADNGILLDCDTPDDYFNLSKLYESSGIPSVDECREIISIYNVESHIVDHCEAVTRLAVFLAKKADFSQKNLKLITAAGLLHDLARKEKNHAALGASIVGKMGFPEVAKIIETHMNIQIDKAETVIDASQIIYLADKLTDETKIIDLESRFNDKIKSVDNIEVKNAIRDRLNSALTIKERIENISGKKLDILLNEYREENKK